MNSTIRQQLIKFLQEDLAIPAAAIALAQQHSDQYQTLPMALWQYGLITLNQLEEILDWLEKWVWTPRAPQP